MSAKTKVAIHKLALGMPPISREEEEALRDDIKEQGLLIPIVKFKGKVVDGVNRLKACQEAGVKPQFIVWDGKEEDLAAFVSGLNCRRRQTTQGQWVMWATINLLPAEQKRTPERLRRHKAALKAKIEGRKPPSTRRVGKTQDKDGAPLAAANIVANTAGVGASSIYAAQAILAAAKEYPRLKDLPADVLAGRVALTKAKKLIKDEEAGEARVKEMIDPAAVKEKTEAGHARDRWFGNVLKEEIEDDKDWKIVVEGQLDDEAYTRLATRLRWRLEEEVG